MIKVYAFLCMVVCSSVQAQIVKLEKNKVTIPFISISNLIMIRADLNGHKNLNFIVDTGSNGIILFDDQFFNYKQLEESRLTPIRGLGSDSLLAAYKVRNNTLKINKNLYSNNIEVFLVRNSKFNLGARYGVTIHGIIGNNFFRYYNLHLQYSKSSIVVSHNIEKKSKYFCIDSLVFINGKPFIQIKNTKNHTYNLLFDSGGDDSFWLFNHELIEYGKPYINDFLGFGLAGELVGKRVKLDSLYFKDTILQNIYVAFPENVYTDYIMEIYQDRDGSAGGEFLKRFDWIIDYQNNKLYYKENKNIKQPFYYNCTGMEIFKPLDNLPLFIVQSVLVNSNAYNAGIQPDDVIVKLDGLKPEDLNLDIIRKILSNSKQKSINVTLQRNDYTFQTEILIENLL